ncbi:MAG: hypothetical protein ACPGID_01150 [Rubricella sp.]
MRLSILAMAICLAGGAQAQTVLNLSDRYVGNSQMRFASGNPLDFVGSFLEPDLIAPPASITEAELRALRDLIARAEAGAAGYDAVQHGAVIRPPDRPTQMTLSAILRWIEETPGQPHAIGRYQIIPSTLRDLIAVTNTPLTARYTPELQDRFADILMARGGLNAFAEGRLDAAGLMDGLARVWAGLPLANGRSAYYGIAGNRAVITRADYEATMATIFPG